MDLIVYENDTTFGSEKWKLLQWLLGVDEDGIWEMRASAHSNFIRVATLTVKFLLSVISLLETWLKL